VAVARVYDCGIFVSTTSYTKSSQERG
jgi:hypothetical protein